MGITLLPNAPFYTGGSTSSDVPGKWPVAIEGHGYLVDNRSDGAFVEESIQLLRQQADQADRPSERSINPADLWRRGQDTWHKGAGQTYVDKPDSDPARYRSSKGIDPWTRGRLSLLPQTDQKRSSANTNVRLQPAGSRLYVTDGTELRYTTDPTVDSPTWSNVTGVPATAPSSMCSDGFNVYTAHGADGIYKTDTGATTTASYATGTVDTVAYVKARVMAAAGRILYNVTASGALPAALLTHPNTDFVWVGFAEGRNVIYAAGYSGDKSEIYRTAVKASGTALDTPVIAGRLPDGEIVRAIYGYLGFVLIGTDQGVRFATADDNGDLTLGELIDLSVAVRCFEGQGQYVWFGWTNYDTDDTGLGRLDLTVFNGGAPAYASDLMAEATQGNVLSVVTFSDRRYISVSGSGVWGQDTKKRATGTIDSGLITFELPETKRAIQVDVRHLPLVGSYSTSLAPDGGTFTSLGTRSTAGSTNDDPFDASERQAETFELRHTLNRSGTDQTTGPTITRHTLFAEPIVSPGFTLIVPVLLYEDLAPFGRPGEYLDVVAEREFLVGLWQSKQVITYQEGNVSFSGFLDRWRFVKSDLTANGCAYQGTFVATIKVI